VPTQEVQAALGRNEHPAVSSGHAGHGGAVNPFGLLPTFVYAYNGAVFEVQRNGRLASVTLFVPLRRAGAACARPGGTLRDTPPRAQ
jgi:hypothetical protein